MSITTTAPVEDAAQAARWLQWQKRYSTSSRRSGMQVRVVFTVIFAALAIAFGMQLLST